MKHAFTSSFDLEESWQKALLEELQKPYIHDLAAFIDNERKSGISIFPAENCVFNAFNYTPFDEVKVVIVGQDPYHGENQAHGLCFSVPSSIPFPPSLVNIFKELAADIKCDIPKNGCLIPWAKQGVLLLNSTLTVQEGSPMSHHGKGWERFTDAVITKLCERQDPIIFLLWGKSALEKGAQISQFNNRHRILTAAHPSPLSAYRGFLGCKHFSKVNALLNQFQKNPIDWKLP